MYVRKKNLQQNKIVNKYNLKGYFFLFPLIKSK